MKKLRFVSFSPLFSLFCLLAYSSPSWGGVVAGIIDFHKVMLTVKQGAKVKEKLKREFDKKQKVLKKQEAQIRKMQKDFEKQSLVMNQSAKAKKEKKIQRKILELQEKSVEFTKEIQKLEEKLKRPIVERAKKIIEEVSKKSNVDLMFERNTASLLYAKNQKDLTKQVIESYDKKYPR